MASRGSGGGTGRQGPGDAGDGAASLPAYPRGELQVGIVGPSGAWRDPGGQAWILVEYRVGLGHWVTALQIDIQDLASPRRSDLRWLKQPR